MAQMQGNSTDWQQIDHSDLRQLVYHTFLPKQLPSNEYTNLDQVHKYLVAIVSEHLQHRIPPNRDDDIIKKTRKLFASWNNVQLNRDSLHTTISNMVKGDMIAIFLKEQNAGLLLAADFTDVDSMFTVAGFAASCSSDMVMSSPSSLLMDYPEECAKIPVSKLLKSQYLAEFLCFLTEKAADISMPKTKKAGRSYVENRDVADPILVVNMIIPALCCAKSRANDEFPRIQKKVRDDVVLSNGTLPFRRSGCWMTIKVAFQISLIRELKDASMATFTYKCWMLSILCSILNAFVEKFPSGDWDLKIQMMAKIARRLEKMRAMFQPISTSYRKLFRFDFDKLQFEITDQLQTIRKRINQEWSTISKSNTVETFTASLQDIENDTKQSLEKLKAAKNVRIKIRQINSYSGTAIPPLPTCPHRLEFSKFPNFSQIISSRGTDLGHITDFELCELEKWILENLDDYVHKENCNAIKDLALQYSKKAFHHYIADPNAYSKFVLVVLKCVQVLDKIAVNQHPLLHQHKHGVDVSFISKILLRGRSELQWAKELENYFNRRNTDKSLPSLIDEQHPSHQSFAVRFAKKSSEMQTVIHEIEIDMNESIEQKLSEIKLAKRGCEELRRQIREVSCNGTRQWVSRKKKYKLVHNESCTKCELEAMLKERLQSVSPYERPLPNDFDMRCAVVFELRLPNEIACLRDILQFFQNNILAMPSLKCHTADIIKYWVSYDGVQRYCRNSTRTAVKLVSTTKPSIVTHHVRSMSIDQNEEDFILPNGLNLLYRGVTTLDTGGIGSKCIFKINESSYNGMQWAINSCEHTPNKVMARLSECPKGLSRSEFIQFGLLRAGNLLQYRNIVLSLVSGKLSLKSEAVVALLCQAIWEAGSSESDNHWNRDAHVDLLEPKFATELLQLVDELVNCNEKNWNDPYTICCLVVIATRVLESTESDDVRKMSVNILKKSRRFAIKWIESIEILITKAMNASENEKNMLKLKRVLAALVVTFSFDVSQCFVSCVMQDKEDLLMWLVAIATLQNELLWSLDKRIKDLGVSDIQRSFLRITINTAIKLEPTISNIICHNSNVLSDFSQLRWLLADPEDAIWEKCAQPHQEVFRCMSIRSKRSTSKNHVVYIDVLLGKFLVDGCPIGKLPEQITSHSEYKRVFQAEEMKVQPNKEGSSVIYTTTTALYNCCSFSFQLHGEILLVQATKNNNCFELLPHYVLDSKLPWTFEESHSHWWDISSDLLHFAKKNFRNIEFSETLFKLDLRTNILKEQSAQSSRTLLAMHSKTVTNLTKVFLRIEKLCHIHVWVLNEKNNEFFVELTVLGLKFHFSNGSLMSNEFPGMNVDKLQDFGSLVGLDTKLILVDTCDKSKKNRKVIVPHGDIQIAAATGNHQKVSINLNSLQNPKFFVYEIDERLQILIAGRNQSAWFYLAALHGATASALPDLLTGLTGTEMAFQILQSARLWSCKSYDEASLKILENIKQFVPKRQYYPSHLKVLQKINWPIGLPPTAAHEGYLLIVEKLLEDSQKLEISHEPTKDNLIWSMELNERHYWRHITYMNDLIKISADFNNENLPAVTPYHRQRLQIRADEDVRLIAHLCHYWICEYNEWMKNFVTESLMRCTTLTGTTDFITFTDRLETEHWFVQESKLKDIHNNWLDMYVYALKVGECDNLRPEWQMILSSMLIQRVDIRHIQILHLIAINSHHFRSLLPPSISKYESPSSTFQDNLIRNEIVTKAFSGEFDSPEAEDFAREFFNTIRQSEIEKICFFVRKSWMSTPMRSVTIPKDCRIVNVPTTEAKINIVIRMWYDNLQLSNFLNSFETMLTRILDNNISESKLYVHPLVQRKSCKSTIVEDPKIDLFSTIVDANLNLDVESKNIYENLSHKYESKHFSEKRSFEIHLISLRNKSTQMWDDLVNMLTGENKKALDASGLHPRLVPLTLIPLLLQHSPQIEHFQNKIGAIGVLWTLEQKMERCIQYLNSGPSMLVAFQREEETQGRKCWVPKEYPGWLLLELELNVTIRPIQYKVAKKMMGPSSNENSVMQLNMGEGKTALIVPMLVVALANGSQLCRVTVIKSIFETNFNALRYTIGGLLNRRVYTIPCRRDIQLTTDICNNFLTIYKECLINRGIVVTLPEHRLSFQLKGYEISGKGNVTLAKSLIDIHKWLNDHARDILDESDELLHVKYQLIYSIGNQEHLDGGELRWKICQGILKCIPKHFADLQVEHGDSVIEYKSNSDNPAIFPHCRILKTNVYPELIDLLAEDFLNGLIIGFASLKSYERHLVKIFLTDNDVTEEQVNNVKELFSDNHRNWTILLTMAGYLRFRVLEAALVKRWRVNFGVDVRNMFRLMAVPFKAKDVASERTEFGHSDIAITFTQLSYYYSGLTDEQILECFHLLKTSKILNPINEYDSWIQLIPKDQIDPSVQRYDGINLDDYEQKSKHLIPMLRKTMRIINFWLNHFVFPKESKQFPGKMTCTAWDLCSENKSLLTTGFSGTNDTQNLLPLTIKQKDLDELQTTNLNLEKILLDPVNNCYEALNNDISSGSILVKLEQRKIKILLDCGALMLELNNEEVASEWLKIDSSLEAVVYFNKKNILTVRDRVGKDCDFELSPFREMLNKCGVYLDDEHTRGTDLKFPLNSQACVTLGSGLTRDKMVQACMRMRMLEKKRHTVTFWASHEVDAKIKAMCGSSNQCGSKDVLEWVKHNSRIFVEDGLIYWTVAAVNYCRKRAAERNFYSGNQTNYTKLGLECTENEVMKLTSMYGHSREKQMFSQIVPNWFIATKKSLRLPDDHIDFKNIPPQVLACIYSLIPTKSFYSQLLDEEQEKELEFELEQELECDPAPAVVPREHHLTIFEALLQGRIEPEVDKEIINVCNIFRGTSVWGLIQQNCWGKDVFVSQDFIETVVTDRYRLELKTMFIRPVNWVIKMGLKNQILIISPFEANRLITQFRAGTFNCSLHLYVPRNLPRQDDLITNISLRLPVLMDFKSHVPFRWDKILPPLALCSGNLYFGSNAERKEFERFLALLPKPRNQRYEEAFNDGFICKTNGFVAPEHRIKFPNEIHIDAFTENPEELVTNIMRIRHEGIFPEDSHVAKLILEGMSVFIQSNVPHALGEALTNLKI